MAVYNPPFFLPVWRQGVPGDGELLFKCTFRSPVAFRMLLPWITATSEVPFTAEAVFTIERDGVQVGTLTFPAEGTVAALDQVLLLLGFIDGRVLTIHAPATADATGAGIAISMLGERMGA